MIKLVLLDLDDTLLLYPQGGQTFIQAYLSSIRQFFQEALGLPAMDRWLMEGVQKSSRNLDPTQLNNDSYWAAIAQHTPLPKAELQAVFDRYYAEVYPGLRSTARPAALAGQVLATLQAAGYEVVIATNPLYPQNPTEQRLAWAGLDPQTTPFSRITHAENSHYCKPYPQYYAEILAHLGYEPDETIMIGDNWINDIYAAIQIGMHSFWIRPPHLSPPGDSLPDGYGSLGDFLDCLRAGWLESLAPIPPQAQHLPPRLLGDVAALCGTVTGIPERFWEQHPLSGEWSPKEVVYHLLNYETQVARPNLERILAEDKPFIRPDPLPAQAYEVDLSGQGGWDLARAWAAERQKTGQWLQALPPEAWARPARHSIYGPTTLLEMTVLITRHDQLHIRQLCQTLGHCE
jgi:FMN phosphatase YigB (HAD superfamily)